MLECLNSVFAVNCNGLLLLRVSVCDNCGEACKASGNTDEWFVGFFGLVFASWWRVSKHGSDYACCRSRCGSVLCFSFSIGLSEHDNERVEAENLP